MLAKSWLVRLPMGIPLSVRREAPLLSLSHFEKPSPLPGYLPLSVRVTRT
ncbi:MAG: hypothetical protein AAB641_01630 [Patescibacteria group bacterium]